VFILSNGEPTKTIKVEVTGGKAEVDRITKERDDLKQLLQDLADKELEEKKQEVKGLVPETEHDSIDEMSGFQLDGYISGLKKNEEIKRKISTGTVKLRERGIYDDIMSKEISAQEYVDFIYEHASNPKSPYYNQTRQYKNHLKGLLKPRDFTFKDVEIIADPLEKLATKELGATFGYKEYGPWLRRKMEEARNAK